jgi:Outer membrane protein beta-barrel domain
LLPSGTAEAGRAHFSGGAHFSAHVGWRGGVSVRYARPAFRSRPWIGGSVWVGRSYYYPRPYYYYAPEYVPSYYGSSYYPVQPMAAPGVAVATPPPPPSMPSFGIGVFAGGSNVQDKQDSSDLGALVRLRLTPGLLVEGEIGKTSFKDDVRVDRRIGGALVYEIGARNTFAPYLLAGLGVQQADVDGSFSTTQDFGEIGVGLRWAMSRNLHLTFDIRAGSRKTIDSNQPDFVSNAARTVAPPSGVDSNNDTEDYTRGRLAAILNF